MGTCSYLNELARRLQRAFGDALLGVYLTGSAAVGAYRHGSSDIDVLVVVERADRDALDRAVESCAHEALACPATKLELVVYEHAALANARWSLNFDTGATTRHVGFDPAAEPSHWFVIDLAFAREHAQALVGPAPSELLPPADVDRIDAAFDELVDWYERHEPEAAGIARARADHWRATRTFTPKPGLPSDC
jgi:hypothetical protein